MTPNVVILCAAGMLVTAYLMVGQKSLFTTIRLYGAQSLLLGHRRGRHGDQRPAAAPLRHGDHDHRVEGVRDPAVS